jgi:hypothetical protein
MDDKDERYESLPMINTQYEELTIQAPEDDKKGTCQDSKINSHKLKSTGASGGSSIINHLTGNPKKPEKNAQAKQERKSDHIYVEMSSKSAHGKQKLPRSDRKTSAKEAGQAVYPQASPSKVSAVIQEENQTGVEQHVYANVEKMPKKDRAADDEENMYVLPDPPRRNT